MKAFLAALLVLAVSVQCSAKIWVPFKWYTVPIDDPEHLREFRTAMSSIGLTTDGVVITSFQEQWTLPTRYNYKAAYTNWQGERCLLKWSVDGLTKREKPKMPQCIRI